MRKKKQGARKKDYSSVSEFISFFRTVLLEKNIKKNGSTARGQLVRYLMYSLLHTTLHCQALYWSED